MCLAVPGKVLEIFRENGIQMGRIDYSGTVSLACLEYVPEVREGEYVIVHAGFAISVLDQKEALESLEVWAQLNDAARAGGTDVFGNPLQTGKGKN